MRGIKATQVRILVIMMIGFEEDHDKSFCYMTKD
jgi:hypothetical protein